jgi:hypothetical protein
MIRPPSRKVLAILVVVCCTNTRVTHGLRWDGCEKGECANDGVFSDTTRNDGWVVCGYLSGKQRMKVRSRKCYSAH